jgi:uncharacterized protein DUF4886
MPTVRVLFIGNSFTARNDLPGTVGGIAGAAGLAVEHRLISAGGASLRRHWNAGTAAEAIRSGRYDRVVLQEQSTLPVKSAARMHESVRLFDAEIRKAGSRTVLYMTWARRHAPEAQQPITDAYTTIARELAADVIPAGLAWRAFLAKHRSPILHDKDGSHPSAAGTYLAACTAFAVLFGRSPVRNAFAVTGVSDKDRQLLQRAAADAVSTSR